MWHFERQLVVTRYYRPNTLIYYDLLWNHSNSWNVLNLLIILLWFHRYIRAIEFETQLYLRIRHFWIIFSSSEPLSVRDTWNKDLFVELFKFNIRVINVWSMKSEELISLLVFVCLSLFPLLTTWWWPESKTNWKFYSPEICWLTASESNVYQQYICTVFVLRISIIN